MEENAVREYGFKILPPIFHLAKHNKIFNDQCNCFVKTK